MLNVADIYPLSPLQEGLLFDSLKASDPGAYLVQVISDVEGNLDVQRLKRAWHKIMERHSVLRTAFVWERVKRPLQVVRKEVVLYWQEHDWSHLSRDHQEEQLDNYLREERRRGFHLAQAPLMRMGLFRLESQRYKLIWNYSLLCLDERSMQIVYRDFLAHYTSPDGGEVNLAAVRPFRDVIALLQRQDWGRAEAHWAKAQNGVKPARLQEFERPAANGNAFSHHLIASDRLDRSIKEKLQAVAEGHGLALGSLVYGAWAWLLSCWSKSNDVVFGIVPADDPMILREANRIAGAWRDALPLCIQVDPGQHLVDWLKQLQERQLELEEYGHISFGEILKWSGASETNSLFETVVIMEDPWPISETQSDGHPRIVPCQVLSGRSYPIKVYIEPSDGIWLRLELEENRFKSDTAGVIIGQLRNTLEGMATGLERKLGEMTGSVAGDAHQVQNGQNRPKLAASQESAGTQCNGQPEKPGLSVSPTPIAESKSHVKGNTGVIEIPENRIPIGCKAIQPEMLPLVELSQEEIEKIVKKVPGGAGNVQDIYPLAPLQEGILFHYLLEGEGDPYLLASLSTFGHRWQLDACVKAMQAVVDRHDILRTGMVWEELRQPVQVVWRKAVLPVEEVNLDSSGDAAEQLLERYNPLHYRVDVRQAPLLHAFIAHDKLKRRWLMLLLLHHMAGDHSTLEVMGEEVQAHLLGRAAQLPKPQPFRNLVAQARLVTSQEQHEAFFRKMLGDIEEPTLPFGLVNVQGDGSGIVEARVPVGKAATWRIREAARKLGVSVASICHVAWALVLAKVSGQENVVFGTVVFGRMGGGVGAEGGMGLFMNTLPIRIQIGNATVQESIQSTHKLLTELMQHEHVPLVVAQRCSGVPAPAPLFSALLNYRNSRRALEGGSRESLRVWEGMQLLGGHERTSYPCHLSVDFGEEIGLMSQTVSTVDPKRVCSYMSRALEVLVEGPGKVIRTLNVLPEAERQQILVEWNQAKSAYIGDKCIHELFEEQAEKTPNAAAVVFEETSLTYSQLNQRANQLAHYLRRLGVKPDARVGICVERSQEMIVGILAILKAGGAYVPLDASYPTDRLRALAEDSAPAVLLTQTHLKGHFDGIRESLVVIDLDAASVGWNHEMESNPSRIAVGLTSKHLAYVIYTSGSTGTPKGVMVEHRHISNYAVAIWKELRLAQGYALGFLSTLAADLGNTVLFPSLVMGGVLHILSRENATDAQSFDLYCRKHPLDCIKITPSHFSALLEGAEDATRVPAQCVVFGGEVLPKDLLSTILSLREGCRIHNHYGPTECTVGALSCEVTGWVQQSDRTVPLGRPLANARIYILDRYQEPVPLGVVGELYIGGAGVTRGYLNRTDLTAERFAPDPFSEVTGSQMYKTGDLVRWLPGGLVEFLGRNDFQVKIRGFRIELGEIEARLMRHSGVREAVVIAWEEVSGQKRLVAYYTVTEEELSQEISTEVLRAHLAKELPDYMIPTAFVEMKKLPLTANGKLDRRAFPAPERESHSAGYEEPVGEVEKTLAEVWAQVLRLEKVGRHDNFFELGGHSLLAVSLIERIRSRGIGLNIQALFLAPTLAELAQRIDQQARVIAVPENRIPSLNQTIHESAETVELRI